MDDQTRQPAAGAADLAELLDEVRQILLDVADTDLTELEITLDGAHIRLRQLPGAAPAGLGTPVRRAESAEASLHAVRSPLNGVYYARPNPNAEPYLTVGDEVAADQVVCLIEAMKSFNEIHAEVVGRVARLVAESGQVVNAGDTLLLIEPTIPAAAPADLS